MTLLAFSRRWPEWSLARFPRRKPDEIHRPRHENRGTKTRGRPPRVKRTARRAIPALQRRCSKRRLRQFKLSDCRTHVKARKRHAPPRARNAIGATTCDALHQLPTVALRLISRDCALKQYRRFMEGETPSWLRRALIWCCARRPNTTTPAGRSPPGRYATTS